MPCPTCNATLKNLGLDQPGRRTFWCPNCGTLKWERDNPGGGVFEETDTPSVTAGICRGGNIEVWIADLENRRLNMGFPLLPAGDHP